MEKKVFKDTVNFLGSEVGKVTKTITVPADFATYVMENGRKIVKAGTIFTSPYLGLLFNDVDITDGPRPAALMIRGSYIDAKLPSSAASVSASFAAQGLYPFVEGSVVRPDYGTVGLTALSAPTPSATLGVISWASISGAVDYTVYNSDKEKLATVSTSSYTVTVAGTYYVGANADNLNYKASPLASVSVSLS